MRRSKRYKRPLPKKQERYRINKKITAKEVRVIDESGQPSGILSIAEALRQAEEKGFDLIEVNPKAEPPVCRFGDYGQFQYEQKKTERKQKSQQKQLETKGIRLTFRISENDLMVRQQQALKFLAKGHKVKVDLFLRGRERQHAELAKKVVNGFVDKIKAAAEVNAEQPLTRQGNVFSAILAPKKQL